MKKRFARLLFGLLLGLALARCGSPTQSTQSAASEEVHLILGAYSTPREAYGEIIPLFQAKWQKEHNQKVVVEESYQGSGAQSRAVLEGFEADVVALSLEADINRIEDAGLISHDWKSVGTNGMLSDSVVAFAVRAGNPLGIADWADLAKPGVEVLTPNPATSGGAMWNILALYGAALRGAPANDPAAAKAFLTNVLRNVTVMNDSARNSIINFEQGVGDVAITYENEVLIGQQAGQDYELVIPSSTILIENPVALVDTYVDKHGSRAVVEAFVEFLFTKEAQEIFARYGLRSVDASVAAATAGQYPAVPDLFTIDFFGGWPQARQDIFGENGVFTQAIEAVQGQ